METMKTMTKEEFEQKVFYFLDFDTYYYRPGDDISIGDIVKLEYSSRCSLISEKYQKLVRNIDFNGEMIVTIKNRKETLNITVKGEQDFDRYNNFYKNYIKTQKESHEQESHEQELIEMEELLEESMEEFEQLITKKLNK